MSQFTKTQYTVSGTTDEDPGTLPTGLTVKVEEVPDPTRCLVPTAQGQQIGVEISSYTGDGHVAYIRFHHQVGGTVTVADAKVIRDTLSAIIDQFDTSPDHVVDSSGDTWWLVAPKKFLCSHTKEGAESLFKDSPWSSRSLQWIKESYGPLKG